MAAAVSIYDIARRAGVSHVTVSNVLNRRGFEHKVSRTRAGQIRSIATELGYVPHRAARTLKLGKTYTVVVATKAQLHHPHVHELIEELREAFIPHGYQILLELLHRTPNPEGVLRSFTAGSADGLIVFGYETEWLGKLVANVPRGMPMVLVGPWEVAGFSSVSYDRVKAAELAVSHLVQLGHRRVLMIYDIQDDLPARQRVEGYRLVLDRAEIPFDESLLIRCAADGDVRALWTKLKSIQPRPTAVYCYNDELALRLLQVIHSERLRVPESVAVVTQGNSRLTTLDETPLTAVDTNNRGIAQAVTEMLLAQIEKPNQEPRRVLVDPSLVVRASTVGA